MFIFWDCTNGSDSNIAQLFSVTFLILKHKSCFWLTKINTLLSSIQCLVYLQLEFPFKVQSQRESPLFWSLSQLSGQGRANIYTDNHLHSYSLKHFYSVNIIVLIYSFLWLFLLKFSYKSINIYKKGFRCNNHELHLISWHLMWHFTYVFLFNNCHLSSRKQRELW